MQFVAKVSLQDLFNMLKGIIETITGAIEVIANLAKGAFQFIENFFSIIKGFFIDTVFSSLQTWFGAIGYLMVGAAVLIIIGAIWEAFN